MISSLLRYPIIAGNPEGLRYPSRLHVPDTFRT
jgi:hypothetical protein